MVGSLSFILAGTASYIAYVAAGATLGAFIGGFFVISLVLPPLLAAESCWAGHVGASVGVVAGVATVWLVFIHDASLPLGERLSVVIAACAFGWSLAGLTIVLVRLRFGPVFAAAIVVLIAIAWLTWPVWLTPYLSGNFGGAVATQIARFNPVLMSNGVLSGTPAWTEEAITYRWLTNLNQDVPVVLPDSCLPFVVGHGIAGLSLLIAGYWGNQRVGCARAALAK